MQFTRRHLLMFPHDNERPRVAARDTYKAQTGLHTNRERCHTLATEEAL